MYEKAHHQGEHHEVHPMAGSDDAKRDLEKTPTRESNYDLSRIATEDQDYFVTAKTTIQRQVAVSVGAPSSQGSWYALRQSGGTTALMTDQYRITAVFITSVTISFMVCGANSDLFGRRYFIVPGHAFVFIGAIVGGTSRSMSQTIAAHVLLGFGSGNCQLAAFAIPELLPNRWRHIGVVIADGVTFFAVIAGPVTARVSITHGDNWRWGYWAVAITIFLGFIPLAFLYYPPKHPRGIPWDQALKHLDWVGIVSFTLSAAMILSGIVYVELRPAGDPIITGLLVAGFGTLLFFALWETFAPLKEPLAPTRLFTKNKGRALTAPFIVGGVVTMFYYGCNIIWGTMISVFFSADQSTNVVYWLATVQGFGILLGGVLLWVCGNYLGHWKWQMGLSVAWMTLFGGLLAYITPERQALGISFAFLSAVGFGYAQYLSITYIQFGADQVELGISGGLAGVSRTAGGAVAATVFLTVLFSVQEGYAATHVVPAAEAAGASPAVAEAVAKALPLGSAALKKVPGLTAAIAEAAGAAFVESFVQGLKTVSLTLMGFGGVAIIACFFIEDIGPKMNKKIEVFLENDVEASRNKFH
ncbi:hypothetical protein LTR66_005528 [Elasticomyces elasticus]|nr:hypothetical protein LTR66_005528 [Elasticomyces elasticus]